MGSSKNTIFVERKDVFIIKFLLLNSLKKMMMIGMIQRPTRRMMKKMILIGPNLFINQSKSLKKKSMMRINSLMMLNGKKKSNPKLLLETSSVLFRTLTIILKN